MPKEKKINKKKLSNVVPLKKKLIQPDNTENILSVEEQERERTNKFARKICDEIDNYVRETKMDTDMTYYHFLFQLDPLAHHLSLNRLFYP